MLRQRLLQKSGSSSGQLKITDYFNEILDDLEALAKENSELRAGLLKLQQQNRASKEIIGTEGELLKLMLRLSPKKQNRSVLGHRYNDSNASILGGRRIYEIFYANFKGALPFPRSIQLQVNKFA